MLPHQTQDSFQHGAGDETTVIYSKLKITPEVNGEVAIQVDEKGKEEVATQVDEKGKEEVSTHKGKEAAQTAEVTQRDEGELADQSNMEEMESECMHVHF